MKIEQGNIAGGQKLITFTSDARMVTKYRVVNTSGGPVTINVLLNNFRIAPRNLIIAPGESFEDERIGVAPGNQLILISSGPVDYHFTIETQ